MVLIQRLIKETRIMRDLHIMPDLSNEDQFGCHSGGKVVREKTRVRREGASRWWTGMSLKDPSEIYVIP